ncbi:MAG: formyltetrahydrofolate deformylase [Campylobacteraceae bacterium]|jgi:formyltetrahydrofolate deformylase|nr:formyltetrahydrofolate deformylase [Campylobacteraceae bacterium]
MEKIVLIDCEDSAGLIYKISKIFFENGLNIEKNDEFVEKEKNRFFMRTEISGEADFDLVEKLLRRDLPKDANLRIVEKNKKKKMLLFATKESHCLGDILIRYHSGEMDADILGVVANHDTLRPLVEKFELPFYHLPAEGISREEHEAKVIELAKSLSPDLLVLAKYMRILTPNFVSHFEGKIVNIHHSFLPAFIGANPYKQAYERGVKIIGATAHFVNNNLDEGPIIAQDIVKVDHSYGWEEMRNLGRDVEKIVLAKAIKLALEERIFVYDNKTVIF